MAVPSVRAESLRMMAGAHGSTEDVT